MKIEIPTGWWYLFIQEGICEDALGYSETPDDPYYDDLRAATKELLELTPYSRTQRVRRYDIGPRLVKALIKHADWYAYEWAELTPETVFDHEVLSWINRGRASRRFCNRLRDALLAETTENTQGEQ